MNRAMSLACAQRAAIEIPIKLLPSCAAFVRASWLCVLSRLALPRGFVRKEQLRFEKKEHFLFKKKTRAPSLDNAPH